MKKRTDNRQFWQGVDGYKLGVALVLALLVVFFLLVTIMPIVLFETLEDISWELKTFATSYRPVAALIGLVLFLATGWGFLRVVRGPQILPRPRRRTTKPAEPVTKPEEGKQTARDEWLIGRLPFPWPGRGTEKPAEPADETGAVAPLTPEAAEPLVKPEKPAGVEE
jgi:hypothetical protein